VGGKGEVVGSPRLLTEENYHNITIYYTEKQNRIIICNIYYSCNPICFSIDPLEIYKTHSTTYFIHNIIKYCALGTYIIKYDFFFLRAWRVVYNTILIYELYIIKYVYESNYVWKFDLPTTRRRRYAVFTVLHTHTPTHPPTHPHVKTIIYTYTYIIHCALSTQAI